MATTSIVYDVLNLLTLDAIIDKYAESKQVLLKQHLSRVKFMEGDLLFNTSAEKPRCGGCSQDDRRERKLGQR